jgi:hypothetical protein
MTWILIFYIYGSGLQGGGPATAQFATKQACQNAGDAVVNKWAGAAATYICVPTS